jgi:hypothetical protein
MSRAGYSQVRQRDDMRFHIGAIPEALDFTPDSSWRALREPSPWLMQFLALPIGVATAAIVGFLWFRITPLEEMTGTLSIPAFLLSFAGIVVVHELIHAVIHPMAGRSPHSILGLWPSRMLFYAAYTGELTRNRFVAILLMPLVIISFLPLLIAAVAQATSGWAAFVSAFNALLACCDIFGAGLVLVQVPSTAIVRNQGWRTYWRESVTNGEPGAPPNGGAAAPVGNSGAT